MAENTPRLSFTCDYEEGAHPAILKRLAETNFLKEPGYGYDEFSLAAKDKIREACGAPNAGVYFLIGGTQTNATVIDAVLRGYQGVVAANTGHVAVHEAGAIEFGGHKVLTVPQERGKVSAAVLNQSLLDIENDGSYEHMVHPGLVYISQPTEYGTLYTKAELEAIRAVCDEHKLPLFIDGARLGYALASPANDVSMKDLALARRRLLYRRHKVRRAPWRSGRDPEPGLHPALLHDDQAAWRPPREGPRRRYPV